MHYCSIYNGSRHYFIIFRHSRLNNPHQTDYAVQYQEIEQQNLQIAANAPLVKYCCFRLNMCLCDVIVINGILYLLSFLDDT